MHASFATPAANGMLNTAKSPQKLHINSIATNLQVKTAADLAVAAARAPSNDKKELFMRSELLDAMKKATLHYKETMSSNLTQTIKSLIGPKLN